MTTTPDVARVQAGHVHFTIAAALVVKGKITEDQAKAIVEAIVRGEVQFLRVAY